MKRNTTFKWRYQPSHKWWRNIKTAELSTSHHISGFKVDEKNPWRIQWGALMNSIFNSGKLSKEMYTYLGSDQIDWDWLERYSNTDQNDVDQTKISTFKVICDKKHLTADIVKLHIHNIRNLREYFFEKNLSCNLQKADDMLDWLIISEADKLE